jgi:sporulation protein YlmC with PRC-barrel domain
VNVLVDPANPVHRNKMMLAIRRILLGQLDLVGAFEVVDRADLLPVSGEDIHVFLDLGGVHYGLLLFPRAVSGAMIFRRDGSSSERAMGIAFDGVPAEPAARFGIVEEIACHTPEDSMLAKHIAIGLVTSALMTGTAFAQSTAPSPAAPAAPAPSVSSAPSSSSSNQAMTSGSAWRTSKLIGVNVYNDSNEKLGSIDELITDKQGKIQKVIIGVGGFLGMGQHDIAVNFDQLKFTDTPVPSSMSNSTAPSGSSTVGSSTTTTTTRATSTADNWYPDHAVMSATKDQLKAMPEFKYDTSAK